MSEQLMLAGYREVIASLPPIMTLKKDELLIKELHVLTIAPLELYYAPHNEVAFEGAKLLIVSLTPGFQQMRLALAEAQSAIWAGASDSEACYRAKQKARFAGAMRQNLISMLDQLHVQHLLRLDSCADLFDKQAHLLNSTAIIPYPAFYKGRNYSGSQPDLLQSASLCSYIMAHMKQQAKLLPNVPIIPLGRSVEDMMRLLVKQGIINENKVLWGFPHPSGANGHRHQQFANNQADMIVIINRWQNEERCPT